QNEKSIVSYLSPNITAPSNLVFLKMLLDFFNVNSADLRRLYSLELEYFNLKNIFFIFIFLFHQ
mgnify:CR=1